MSKESHPLGDVLDPSPQKLKKKVFIKENTDHTTVGGGDSSVVRALDS